MHNYSLTTNGITTKLKIGYAQIIQAHVVRDWLGSHPRIVLPIVVFLLGSLTYAVIANTLFFQHMRPETMTDL